MNKKYMHQILLLAGLFTTINLFGQSEKLTMTSIKQFTKGDNSSELVSSAYEIFLRFHLPGQTIDLFSQHGITFQGMLTNTISEYRSVKSNYGGHDQFQFIEQKIPLNIDTSTMLAKRILTSGQADIPTDSLIPNWNKRYLHCNNIVFELKIRDTYSKQIFDCPWYQPDSITFLDVIMANYNLLQQILELEKRHREFLDILPKGKTYSQDGYRMMYIMTNRESKRWKLGKPKRDYHKSIKDSIDHYLKSELTKQEIELGELNCFEDYQIKFNRKGKFVRIEVSKHDRPKIRDGIDFYLEGRREARNCKKLIKQLFHQIDLTKFHLKYSLSRTLSFDYNGEIQITDRGIY